MKKNLLKKLRNKLSKLLPTVKKKPKTVTIFTVCLLCIGLAYAANTLMQSMNNDVTASSVMITNSAGNSGGTGIIIKSSMDESIVLTNSHVCRVIEEGGLISGAAGTFIASGYKRSTTHDLCLIRVEGDLKFNTKIASRAPVLYYEKAVISGHPALLPNVVTSGHFSGRKTIQVLTRIRECTDEDTKNQQNIFLCLTTGGIPVIREFDAVLVTATIMPGSSGSGVYNKDLELSGVAFAGSGDIGYAWTVPYESMRNFLLKDQFKLDFISTKTEHDLTVMDSGRSRLSEADAMRKLKNVCASVDREKAGSVCDILQSDILWVK